MLNEDIVCAVLCAGIRGWIVDYNVLDYLVSDLRDYFIYDS